MLPIANPGMVPPKMGWSTPPFAKSHFLNWGFLLSDGSRLCQIDMKLANTTCKNPMRLKFNVHKSGFAGACQLHSPTSYLLLLFTRHDPDWNGEQSRNSCHLASSGEHLSTVVVVVPEKTVSMSLPLFLFTICRLKWFKREIFLCISFLIFSLSNLSCEQHFDVSRINGFFFINCVYIYTETPPHTHTHIHYQIYNHNLLSLFFYACNFRADHLGLDNQLRALPWGKLLLLLSASLSCLKVFF